MERVLSKKEKKILLNAGLTPKAERIIAETWSKEKELPKEKLVSKIIGSLIGIMLIPLLIFILGANTFHWASISKGFENIAFLVIWIFFIFIVPIFALCRFVMACSQNSVFVLSQSSIKVLAKKNVLNKYFSRIVFIALIGLITFRGEIFTAICLLVAWASALFFSFAFKEKIRIAVQKIG